MKNEAKGGKGGADKREEEAKRVPAKPAAAGPAPARPSPAPAARDGDEEDEEGEDGEDAVVEKDEDLDDAEGEDGALNQVLNPDTSERIILVVDEEGQRRNETVAIITQILPNAVIEVAGDPDEAMEMMQEGDFDTYVVNFLMPGYSSSPFVKAVANHPDHPLLIGFAADKMSDAVDPKKGLKIIPLKRLFDLNAGSDPENAEAAAPGEPAPED